MSSIELFKNSPPEVISFRSSGIYFVNVSLRFLKSSSFYAIIYCGVAAAAARIKLETNGDVFAVYSFLLDVCSFFFLFEMEVS